jgi:hypothetical protein
MEAKRRVDRKSEPPRLKFLVVVVAVAVMGVSSAAMARGGSGGGGKSGGHGQSVPRSLREKPVLFGDGFDWGFGGPILRPGQRQHHGCSYPASSPAGGKRDRLS